MMEHLLEESDNLIDLNKNHLFQDDKNEIDENNGTSVFKLNFDNESIYKLNCKCNKKYHTDCILKEIMNNKKCSFCDKCIIDVNRYELFKMTITDIIKNLSNIFIKNDDSSIKIAPTAIFYMPCSSKRIDILVNKLPTLTNTNTNTNTNNNEQCENNLCSMCVKDNNHTSLKLDCGCDNKYHLKCIFEEIINNELTECFFCKKKIFTDDNTIKNNNRGFLNTNINPYYLILIITITVLLFIF